MANCFRLVLDCVQGPSFTATASYAYQLDDQMPRVKIDSNRLGKEVVLVKGGQRLCGRGGALATAPLVQDKAYFEVKLQQGGQWAVGLAHNEVDVESLPTDKDARCWLLRQDGRVYHADQVVASVAGPDNQLDEGDVLGVTYDHIELNFLRNGEPMGCVVSGVKGNVFPVFYVDDRAILDVQFSGFWYAPPAGFGEILLEQTIL